MRGYLAILALTLLIAASSCSKNNSDSKAPQIAFIGMQPNTVRSGSGEDTVFIAFNITDANADIGNPQTQAPDSFDIYLIDSRGAADTTNIVTDTIKLYFPEIPGEAVPPGKPLEGMSMISLLAAKYLYSREDSLRTRDTVRFEVFVKDKAMNVSNRFTTPDIYIER
ncbi:MAG: hypothetical protein K0R82_571 [Flavipsychrobacter sp.]|jgi:hypothetical protein|nr:hypothetical protein [Flavipsychrobacter sp.]